RCLVLRGAGGKAFASGADISEFEAERADPAAARAYAEATEAAMSAIGACVHPTVALIEGACIGGGLEIAMRCDLRICGRSSRFGIPSNRLGLVIGYAELEALMAAVGRARALEILLEARIFDAEEAYEKGLVQRVVDDAEVAAEAYASAARIAAGAPLVNRWHKKFMRRLAIPEPLSAAEREEALACFGTADYGEGWRAFLAKRRPQFEGR
ncbi:MAG: enoyl-CoA hydratase-related protein, partial [Alphaproteobacteria bacterium]